MSNDALVLLAALSSIQLSKGLTSEQLELLSAFFEILGDNLALLALQANICQPGTE
ncbi:MAG: hypothetical protein J6C43_03830 [Oscillospiraceae bacterium]|nr:hypothetical protein [Oscillospiraceae bacterium]